MSIRRFKSFGVVGVVRNPIKKAITCNLHPPHWLDKALLASILTACVSACLP